MLILALDLGGKTGWCLGDSQSTTPLIGVEKLPETPEGGCGHLARFLRTLIRDHGKPDHIAVEQFMRPAASMNETATVKQLLLHGALHGVAGIAGIPVTAVAVATLRLHFVGRATAFPPRKRGQPPRTTREKAAARAANKQMVLDRAKLLGYLPRHSTDTDAADAAAVFDWAKAHLARQAPRELVMFGQVDSGREHGSRLDGRTI